MKWPVSSLSGTVVIVIYCAFTFTSWALYPAAYNPINNWLSDLGNSTYNPTGAVLYNAGCILTGIALFPFFIGFYKWYTPEMWRKIMLILTQVVGCLAAFSLMMIGVFSENYGAIHGLWSTVFFVLNLAVLVLVGISLFAHSEYLKPVAYYGFIVAIVNLLFVVFYDFPILEWFTVFTALAYVGSLSYNMIKARLPQ